jgi:hypothetical protein
MIARGDSDAMFDQQIVGAECPKECLNVMLRHACIEIVRVAKAFDEQ